MRTSSRLGPRYGTLSKIPAIRWIAGTLVIAAVASWAHAEPVSHPRLVDAATTHCTDCHDDLWQAGAVVHDPVSEDCTTCHEFSGGEGGTLTSLMEEGTALCVMCHDSLGPAAEAELEASHPPVTEDCVTCHDPHGSNSPTLLTASLIEVCAECHDSGDLAAPHGGQLTGGADCSSCHDPHGSGNPKMLLGSELHAPFSEGSCKGCHRAPFADRIRLRSRGEKLCTSCHGAFKPPGRDDPASPQTVHAAMKGKRGRAGCLSCHDPHMSSNSMMLIEVGNQLCSSCHEKIVRAASAETGHVAADDDCFTCHSPHTSTERKLLNEPAEELCAMCHDTTDEELAASHLGAQLDSLQCTSCHDPHGSEHGTLLARYLHEALEMGCDTCHDGGFDSFVEEGSEICLSCHDDVGAEVEVPHEALEIAACADCHNPHASNQERLVKLPGGGVCADCHDEQIADDGEVAHAVVDLIGCRACHEPHGSTNEKLLRKTGAELCLACHDPSNLKIDAKAGTVRVLDRFDIETSRLRSGSMASLRLSDDGEQDHPVTNHRVLGQPTEEELKRVSTTFEGELTCLTCHDPHKGRSAGLFRWNATSEFEVCQQCHDK